MKANQVILQCQHLLRKKFQGAPALSAAASTANHRRTGDSIPFDFRLWLKAF